MAGDFFRPQFHLSHRCNSVTGRSRPAKYRQEVLRRQCFRQNRALYAWCSNRTDGHVSVGRNSLRRRRRVCAPERHCRCPVISHEVLAGTPGHRMAAQPPPAERAADTAFGLGPAARRGRLPPHRRFRRFSPSGPQAAICRRAPRPGYCRPCAFRPREIGSYHNLWLCRHD